MVRQGVMHRIMPKKASAISLADRALAVLNAANAANF
jgi:hypothetical protein